MTDAIRAALVAAAKVCGRNNCNCPGAKSVRDRVEAALAEDAMREWQPMSAAPKDGLVLLWFDQTDALAGNSAPVVGAISGEWHVDNTGEGGWMTAIGFIGEPAMWAPVTFPQTGVSECEKDHEA